MATLQGISKSYYKFVESTKKDVFFDNKIYLCENYYTELEFFKWVVRKNNKVYESSKFKDKSKYWSDLVEDFNPENGYYLSQLNEGKMENLVHWILKFFTPRETTTEQKIIDGFEKFIIIMIEYVKKVYFKGKEWRGKIIGTWIDRIAYKYDEELLERTINNIYTGYEQIDIQDMKDKKFKAQIAWAGKVLNSIFANIIATGGVYLATGIVAPVLPFVWKVLFSMGLTVVEFFIGIVFYLFKIAIGAGQHFNQAIINAKNHFAANS